MTYLDDFFNALQFLTKFNKEYKKSRPDFEGIQKILRESWDMRNDEVYKNISIFISKLAVTYVSDIPLEHIINQCHSTSQRFWDRFQKTEISNDFSINITIGNVIYKNKNIYNLSKSKLKKIINEGQVLTKALDVHVWLTVEDMTVVDLTIMPTLYYKGLITEEEFNENPVLIWREDIESDFEFKPLLVDNEFMHRVDKYVSPRDLT